jgi:type II secretory pathway pseudopilin PulG
MKPWPQSLKARSFTLIELIVVVLLLAVFSTVLAELFMVTTRTQREATRRDTLLQRFDVALNLLRHDTWSATSIDADGSVVNLPSVEGTKITWRYSTDGKLSRTLDEPTSVQTWGDMPPVAFSAHGPLLTLTLKAVNHDETVTFVSEQMEGGAK